MAKKEKEETTGTKRTPATMKWSQVNVGDTEEREAWDFLTMGSLTGALRNVKVVPTEYEGSRRERTLAIVEPMDDEGNTYAKVNAWLPAMAADGLRRLIGKCVRITRTGEGKKDTRYSVEVGS